MTNLTLEQTQTNNAFLELRTHRDKLLLESDWTQSPDSPLTDAKKTEWATYRQALRDLPDTYSDIPKTSKGYLDWGQITWPTKP